eukprot:4052121-Prymnesium_polylepis.1
MKPTHVRYAPKDATRTPRDVLRDVPAVGELRCSVRPLSRHAQVASRKTCTLRARMDLKRPKRNGTAPPSAPGRVNTRGA